MKNTIKLLGIITFVTVIGFSFTACEDPPCPHTNSDSILGSGVVPTCTEEGWYERQCWACGEIFQVTREPFGHQGLSEPKAATCSEPGNSAKYGTCTRTGNQGCGGTVIAGTVIAALGHQNINWTSYNATNGKISACERANCAGGFAIVGDTGPKGGKIAYVNREGFDVTNSSGGGTDKAYYLEAAPGDAVGTFTWASSSKVTADISGTKGEIGEGLRNTQVILAADSDAPAALAANGYGNPSDSWFLPSENELKEMHKARIILGITTGSYWSSTQVDDDPSYAFNQPFSSSTTFDSVDYKTRTYRVRTVRAF
ncbi:MAG: DUF1566 domain-containing protein [Treponema sp.]|nr:DUF1566 domain-containing protein [Treponema sp.]MCL2251686.1 DUF1566 domain-containing protein [Treponema sp.]